MDPKDVHKADQGQAALRSFAAGIAGMYLEIKMTCGEEVALDLTREYIKTLGGAARRPPDEPTP